jgi:hypothetical protein
MRITGKFRRLVKNKFIKTATIIFAVFILLYIVASLSITYYLSPESLNPIIVRQIHTSSNAEVNFGKTEISMFMHFPNVSISLNNGNISLKNDSVNQPNINDSICSFKRFEIRVNPYIYLFNKKVNISSMILDSAIFNLHTDKSGISNWEKLILQDSIPTDSTESISDYINSITLDKIEFNDLSININDELNQINSHINKSTGILKGNFSFVNNNLDAIFNTQSVYLSQGNTTLIKDMKLGSYTQISLNIPNRSLVIENGVFKINGIGMATRGYLRYNPIQNSTEVDISAGLEVPSIETFINLVPNKFIRDDVNMETSGTANVNAEIKGQYNKRCFPVVKLSGEINDGKFKYDNMAAGFEDINLRFYSNINLNRHSESMINISNFECKALSSEISMNGEINNIIDNPTVKGNIKADINFSELTNVFPLKDSVTINGKLNSEMSIDFIVNELMNQNLSRFKAKGSAIGKEIKIESPNDSLLFTFDKASLLFKTNSKDKTIQQGKNIIDGDMEIENLEAHYKNCSTKMKHGYMTFKSSPIKDTTAILSLTANLDANKYLLRYNDSVYIKGVQTNVLFKLSPSKKDKLLPKVESQINMDSIFLMYENHRMRMHNGELDLISEKDNKENKYWNSEGKISYNHIGIFSKHFPLLIKLPKSTLSLYDNKLRLDETNVIIGESKLSLNGDLENIKQSFLNNGKLRGRLGLKAEYINVNEIIKALQINEVASTSLSSDSITDILDEKNLAESGIAANDSVSSDSLSLFVIPENFDLVLNTDIKAIKFGKLNIDNFQGELFLRNQSLEIDNLSFNSEAADMVATLLYRTRDKEKAYTGFDIKMKDIKVGKLVNIFPALDTLVPMLNSLDGVVNFNIAAESDLDRNLSPIISSINAAINLRGDSLVLMNGDTFAEISKRLRFKNKEKNIIDSVAVNLLIHKGLIEVYPFSVSIDRYQAAISGKHSLEKGFEYHISLLESPIPFKVGINIKGDMDKFKFNICKPKFKNLNDVARYAPLDSSSQNVRQNIKKSFFKEIKEDTTKIKIEAL